MPYRDNHSDPQKRDIAFNKKSTTTFSAVPLEHERHQRLPALLEDATNENAGVKNNFLPTGKAVRVTEALDSLAAPNILSITTPHTVGGAHPLKTSYGSDSLLAATNNNKKRGKKRMLKMQWGCMLGAGVGDRANGFAGSNNSRPIPTGQANMSGNTVTVVRNNSIGASAIQAGFAGYAGIQFRKPITPTFAIQAGLQYFYSSDQIRIGRRNVASLWLQYANGRSVLFTNKFHCIQLPVLLSKQPGVHSRFSVEGGMVLALLAGSRALQYDEQKNIYYQDKGNARTMQVNALVGIGYRILQKRCTIELGPQVTYAFSNLFRNETGNNRHLFFAGITGSIYLNRKK